MTNLAKKSFIFLLSVFLYSYLSDISYSVTWPNSARTYPQGLSGDYGPRFGLVDYKSPEEKFHRGLDFPDDPEVKAIETGEVIEVGPPLKPLVRIKTTGTNRVIRYFHMASCYYKKGQTVTEGWVIGKYETGQDKANHVDIKIEPTEDSPERPNPLRDLFKDLYTSSIPQIKSVELYGDVLFEDKIKANGKVTIEAKIETETKDLDKVEFILSGTQIGWTKVFDYHDWQLSEGMSVISYTDKSTAAIDSFRYDFDTWNFDAGDYTLTVKATDVKGSSTTKTLSFTVDKTAKIKLEKAEVSPEIFSPQSTDPSKQKTEITYTLNEELAPVIEIYNEKGELVRTLIEKPAIQSEVWFSDDFNDGNADGWTPVLGPIANWKVENGEYSVDRYSDGTEPWATSRRSFTKKTSYNEYAVKVSINVKEGKRGWETINIGEMGESYGLFLDVLNDKVNEKTYPYPLDHNQWYRLKIRVIGDRYAKGYVNETFIFSVTFSGKDESTSAKIILGAGDAHVHFDSVTVVGMPVSIPTESTGTYKVQWDGKDGQNNFVGDGIYTYKVKVINWEGDYVGQRIGTVTIDNTPPTVAITSPYSGQTVSGKTTIRTDASDNVGIKEIAFYVDDNRLIGTDTDAPYSYDWYTTDDSDGEHTLKVVAYDFAGNQNSHQISVNVEQNVSANYTVATSSTGQAVDKVYYIVEDTSTPRAVTALSQAANVGLTLVDNLYDIAPDGTVFPSTAPAEF
ncbi:MAG TPA: hypothetical protein DHV62_07550, partial [Elusimicrobia bacterium]|nr:hypothetical protein [Elusimicrobiota bacterium]